MVYETRYTDSLTHYGIKGQKWGVRRFQRKDGTRTPAGKKRYSDRDESDKHKMSIGKKVAIGAAVTAGVLATAYATYTVGKAYSRQKSLLTEFAEGMARGMATNSESVQKAFNVPAFDQAAYDKYFKETMSDGMKKLFKAPITKVMAPEITQQTRLIKDTASSIRKRVAPDMFDIYGPESMKQILDRYNDNLFVTKAFMRR